VHDPVAEMLDRLPLPFVASSKTVKPKCTACSITCHAALQGRAGVHTLRHSQQPALCCQSGGAPVTWEGPEMVAAGAHDYNKRSMAQQAVAEGGSEVPTCRQVVLLL
jgi:hypothetical protein